MTIPNGPYGNAYGHAMGTSAVCRFSVVEFSGGNGAPGEIRTPDPQIRSLVRTIEIIEVRYRKKLVGRGNARIPKLTQLRLLPKDYHEQWLSQMG